MSQPTIPPPLSADGVRVQRLEREFVDLKSSYDKALDEVFAYKTEIQRKDADMQRLISEKLGAAAESKAALGKTKPSAGSSSQKASTEMEEANRKLRERIETLEKRNETLEKAEEQGCSDAVRYESLVSARLKRLENGHRTIQNGQRTIEDGQRMIGDGLRMIGNGQRAVETNMQPSTDELSALKSLKDRRLLKAAHADPPTTKPALQVPASGGKGSTPSGNTANPNVVPDQGFVTPSKGKTAPVNQGQPKPSVEAYDASGNRFGILADTPKPVPEKSQSRNPQTSEQAFPPVSGEDTRSSGDGTATNTGIGGTPKAINQQNVLKAGEAKKPQVPSASPTPLSAPTIAERQTLAPDPAPPRTPQQSQEMGANKKGKQPESRYGSSPARDTARTAAEVLASPPPPKPFSPVQLEYLEAAKKRGSGDAERKSKIAARIANMLLLSASEGKVDSASPRQATKGGQAPQGKGSAKIHPSAPIAHGVHGDSAKRHTAGGGPDLGQMLNERFGETSETNWAELVNLEESKPDVQPGVILPKDENATDKSMKGNQDTKGKDAKDGQAVDVTPDTPTAKTVSEPITSPYPVDKVSDH